LNHERTKFKIGNFFRKIGFSVTFECLLRENFRNQYIDLVVIDKKTNFKIGVEIDRATPKFKSIEKLKKLHPDLALMILRSFKIPKDKIQKRLQKFPFNFAVLSLPKKSIIFSNLIFFSSKQNKTYNFEKIRRKYPNAYAKWAKKDDKRLIDFYTQDITIEKMARLLKRKPGAIHSRLRKLNKFYYKI